MGKSLTQTVVSFDEYTDDPEDLKIKKDLYIKALEQHGAKNVRYCKVVPVEIKTMVSIDGV